MSDYEFPRAVDKIIKKDPRYKKGAYYFVRDALEHTVRDTDPSGNPLKPRHVTGQTLLHGIRDFALKQFGPMTLTVLEYWNVRKCEDFGEIVFNLVDTGVLSATEKDSRGDFANGYDFYETFKKPFELETH